MREVGREARTFENKRKKEAKHKQGSFKGKGKEEAVVKRKRRLSEEANEAQEQQHEEGVDGSRTSAEAAKEKRAKCPHNCQKEAGVRNAAAQASASTTAKEASASNAAGRASASKTTSEAGASNTAGRASASKTG